MSRLASWLIPSCSILLLLAAANAQMPGMMGMGRDEPKAAAVTSDIKYIRCQVCESMVKQASRRVKTMRSELKPGHRLDESKIIEYLENMCNTAKPDGLWINHYDIVETGDKLKLVDTGKPSKCNTECATIARACSDLSEDLDLSDLSEALFAGKSRSSITQTACYDMTDACTVKPPPVPKDRAPGPPHVPMTADEAQREEMMASMKAAGLSGQMYNRDDIMSQMNDLQDMADGGQFNEVPLHEVPSDDTASSKPAAGVSGVVNKAGEAVQEVIGQAKEAAAAAVEKAGGYLKSTLGKISSSLKGVREQEL